MAYKNKAERTAYMRRRRANNPEIREKERLKCREWAKANPEKAKRSYISYREELKFEVLTHYGKDGKLQCCWEHCEVCDVDMLTLDHLKDNGAEHRRIIGKGSSPTYLWAKREGFPEGFQTLCWNHQWKKQLNRVKGRTQCR